ncbi:Uncharacterized protein dnl_12160 [Desulfonema limicola]|uniref:Uncharacterized protein n=1 Tax=Desulfonema limicola TaxID=45656 RepID=A0A975B582_9BACT|nr:Uncharacterized protein dnl_12160 [Desulfonema limicola]
MAALAARAGTGACPYGCYEIFDEVLSAAVFYLLFINYCKDIKPRFISIFAYNI